MPPITPMKMTSIVQSVMLNEAVGATRSFSSAVITPARPRKGAVHKKQICGCG